MANQQPRRHEYVGFEDESGTTWMFDLSFLLSNWTCIFGSTCKGVLTEDATSMVEGCCSYGAHFADADDRKDTKVAIQRLTADTWEKKAVTKAAGGPLMKNEDGVWVTRLVDDTCCFLNSEDFHYGAGCALHLGALLSRERPMDWKPDVCWQVPLRLQGETDDLGHDTFTLREWKRRDWGVGGEEFHWWCTETHEAFVGQEPVYLALADEIIELVGEEPYTWLCNFVDSQAFDRNYVHPSGAGHSTGQPVELLARPLRPSPAKQGRQG